MAITFKLGNAIYSDDMLAGYGYQDALPRMFASFAGDLSQFATQYAAFQAAVLSGPVSAVSGMSGAVALASPNQKVMNADFRISQRAKTWSLSSGGIPLCDRWNLFCTQTGTVTVTQAQAQDLAQGENISAYLEFNIPASSAGVGACYLSQKIEDLRSISNLRGTLNILVWSQNATNIDRIDMTAAAGTGGTGTASISRVNNVPLSAGWNKLQQNFTSADLSTKTLGPDSNLSIGIQMKNSVSGDAKLLRFGRVWIDENNGTQFPTNGRFVELPIQQAQSQCERYYERVPVENTFTATAAGQVFRVSYPLVRKAKNPALTRPVAGTLTNCTAALEPGPDPTGAFTVALTSAAAGLVSIAGAIVAADAEL